MCAWTAKDSVKNYCESFETYFIKGMVTAFSDVYTVYLKHISAQLAVCGLLRSL